MRDIMNEISEHWIEIAVTACILGVVAAVALPIIDWAAATTKVETVVVIEKNYSADNRSTGTAIIPQSNGGVGVGVVNSGSPEKYILIVKGVDGEVFSREVDATTYAGAVVGKMIQLRIYYGKFSGARY